jgi:cupin fold WbuC family metalloprotein
MKKAEFINRKKLHEISSLAKESNRRRKNYNFHNSDDDICHRLLNAMEPDSYIQPHRHLDINKDETLIVLRGKMGLFIFDEHGNIEEISFLEPNGDVLVANIPSGKYHTWVSLAPDSVFFEAKGGPYRPLTADEKAPWAPEEGDQLSQIYLLDLKNKFETLV